MKEEAVRFLATESKGDVSGLLLRPSDAWLLLVFGHGAGAPMTHPFMVGVAQNTVNQPTYNG